MSWDNGAHLWHLHSIWETARGACFLWTKLKQRALQGHGCVCVGEHKIWIRWNQHVWISACMFVGVQGQRYFKYLALLLIYIQTHRPLNRMWPAASATVGNHTTVTMGRPSWALGRQEQSSRQELGAKATLGLAACFPWWRQKPAS